MAAAVRTRLAHDGAPGTVLGEPLVGVGGPVPGGDGWGPRTIRYHGSFQCPAPPPPAPLRDAQAFQPDSFRWQQVGIGEPLPDGGRQPVPVHRACRGQERPGEQRLHRPDSGTRETRNIGEPHDHPGHRHVGDRRPARGAFPVDDPPQSMISGPSAVRITFCGCRSRCNSTGAPPAHAPPPPCPRVSRPPAIPSHETPAQPGSRACPLPGRTRLPSRPRNPPPSRAAGPVPAIPSHENPRPAGQPGLSLPSRATKPPPSRPACPCQAAPRLPPCRVTRNPDPVDVPAPRSTT